MAMSVGQEGDEDEVMSAINTTPLVDVMLVLLIIFLITIPVAIETVPLTLPTAENEATTTKPENIVIEVDREGQIYWNHRLVGDRGQLLNKVVEVAVLQPQPEVHIRADKDVPFEDVGRVLVAVQQGGIQKVAFITEPQIGQ
jgi:biopolymer transport protein ExbD